MESNDEYILFLNKARYEGCAQSPCEKRKKKDFFMLMETHNDVSNWMSGELGNFSLKNK